ncbi:MAG: hypothetical protein AAFR61_01285 [Bacteroidota bacterium]
MRKLSFFVHVLMLPALLLTGCEGFWGTKTDTEFLDEPVFDNETFAYVPIQPVWDELTEPVDIIAGWDELMYVADAGSEEIVAYDQAGNEQGRYPIPGLTSIAQDRRLDILATGTLDTVINGNALTLSAIYRLDLNKRGPYGLNNASIKGKIIHPFYFKTGTPNASDAAVRLTGIAPLADNRYYVSRQGPSNNPNQFGGPDNSVLFFSEADEFVTPVVVNTTIGLFRDYFKTPVSIASIAQPPQSPLVDNLTGDFLFAGQDENAVLKVQKILRSEDDFGVSYSVADLASIDTSKASGFLLSPFKFSRPADVTFAGDRTRYMFVVDAEKDSLFQFNANGLEGINPPGGSSFTKNIKVSFGGTGTGLRQFSQPSGVAYLNEIVYVADAGNGRVLRFKLTSDFD